MITSTETRLVTFTKVGNDLFQIDIMERLDANKSYKHVSRVILTKDEIKQIYIKSVKAT